MKISVIDDSGKKYDGEIELTGTKKGKLDFQEKNEDSWYRPGSTIEKIITLIDAGFFNNNRTITDIINQLKSMDFHYKASDLTLPLRKIVRKGLLTKTKELVKGGKSKNWTYLKN